MSNEGEWQTAGRRRMQGNKTQQGGRFNRFHAQKRVSILEQVSNGSLEPGKAEQLLRPAHYRSIPRSIYCRTTKSGAVAVYGFSTRPLVLYEDRWHKFFEWLQTGELESYLCENSEELRKPNPVRERSDAVTDRVASTSTTDAVETAEDNVDNEGTSEVVEDDDDSVEFVEASA